MRDYGYFEPETIAEACALLAKYGKESQIIAGGTDLLVKMKDRLISPKYLININKISNLNQIRYEQSVGLRIGTLSTHSDVVNSPVVNGHYPVLAQASNSIGGVQVRNLGTIGGNICNASPASDASIALMALEAKLEATGCNGKREIPIQDFFVGPGATALKDDEILTEIRLEEPKKNTQGVFIKLGAKKAMQVGIATVALFAILEPHSVKVRDLRIALGSVAPTPVRAFRAEDVIRGKDIEEEFVIGASEAALLDISPITDFRGTAEYRREMVKVLVKRAFNEVKHTF